MRLNQIQWKGKIGTYEKNFFFRGINYREGKWNVDFIKEQGLRYKYKCKDKFQNILKRTNKMERGMCEFHFGRN